MNPEDKDAYPNLTNFMVQLILSGSNSRTDKMMMMLDLDDILGDYKDGESFNITCKKIGDWAKTYELKKVLSDRCYESFNSDLVNKFYSKDVQNKFRKLYL